MLVCILCAIKIPHSSQFWVANKLNTKSKTKKSLCQLTFELSHQCNNCQLHIYTLFADIAVIVGICIIDSCCCCCWCSRFTSPFVIVGYICIHFKDPIHTPLSHTHPIWDVIHSFIPRLVVHCLNKLQFSNSSPQLNFTRVSNNSMALLLGCSDSLSVSTTHYSNHINSTLDSSTQESRLLDYLGKLLPNKSCVE